MEKCGQMWENVEKRPFIQVAAIGLGKYHTDSYNGSGSIGLRTALHWKSKII